MNTWPPIMAPLPPLAPSPPSPPSSPAQETPRAAPDAELPPEVARLFRRSLAQGRIHPLMPPLLRYRRKPAP